MHVISAADLSRHLNNLMDVTTIMRRQVGEPPYDTYYTESLQGKYVGLWFDEPSTRTRTSFDMAVRRLMGQVVNIPAENSTVKGESFADSLTVLAAYGLDALVVRRREPLQFSDVQDCPIPVINAGDGSHEHPTQALLDLFTIYDHKKHRPSFHVCLVGDVMNSRVLRSLVQVLCDKSSRLVRVDKLFVYSTTGIPQWLSEYKEVVVLTREIDVALTVSEVLYVVRPQVERGSQGAPFSITQDHLAKLHKDAIIMHPGPRTDELPPFVDRDPRAVYFKQQVANGLYTRMALLHELIGNK